MMAYDFVATQSKQITIIVVQPSFRQTYDSKIMIQHIQIVFKIAKIFPGTSDIDMTQ